MSRADNHCPWRDCEAHSVSRLPVGGTLSHGCLTDSRETDCEAHSVARSPTGGTLSHGCLTDSRETDCEAYSVPRVELCLTAVSRIAVRQTARLTVSQGFL